MALLTTRSGFKELVDIMYIDHAAKNSAKNKMSMARDQIKNYVSWSCEVKEEGAGIINTCLLMGVHWQVLEGVMEN